MDVTGDFSRTPSDATLETLLAEVQKEGLTVPQADGESVLAAFEEAVFDEDEAEES